MNVCRRAVFCGFFVVLGTSSVAAQAPVRTLLSERVVPNPPLPPQEVTIENGLVA